MARLMQNLCGWRALSPGPHRECAMTRTITQLTVAAVAGLALLGTVCGAYASQDLQVANTGTDNTDCGPEGKLPCRSISRAIAHAEDGDTIVVGPGVYGDINNDYRIETITDDTGEEAWVQLDPDNIAIINVNKRLTIVSRDGANDTVIDSGNTNYDVIVRIAADGVVFGKPGKGFTIRHGGIGVMVDGVSDVRVAGNTAEMFAQAGFAAGSLISPGVAERTMLRGNKAVLSSWGFIVLDKAAVVRGNIAVQNSTGFLIGGTSGTKVSKNLAVGNHQYGFLLQAIPLTDNEFPGLRGNAAIANWDAGVRMNVNDVVVPVSGSIENNTIMGNYLRGGACDGGARKMFACTTNADCPPSGQYDPPHACQPDYNCGLAVHNATNQPVTVTADGNYWGDPNGPGPAPADSFGGSCDFNLPMVVVSTWASSEIKVAPKVK
ncbi:MAG: NosD domain-containing protein [Candidatus Binatia bacterium]